jgi:hypothetical protein
MKVLVQNSKTRIYFRSGIAWTNDVTQAFDFQTPDLAERFCKENGLVHVRVVLQVTRPKRDRKVPPAPASSLPTARPCESWASTAA